MSQANVETARRGIEAAIRKPKPDFDAMNDVYHPDHEFVPLIAVLEGGSRSGARGYRSFLRDLNEAMESDSRLEDVTEIDSERVLAIVPTRSRGKSSGVGLDEERIACVLTVRRGKIMRTELYRSPEEALQAAGQEG
jgi:ketosteroid isomerase-like protein